MSIISVITLTGIAGIILPEGKIGNYVKSIFALITLVVLLNPIVSLLKNPDSSLPTFDDSPIYGEDKCFLDYIDYKTAVKYEEAIGKALEEKGYVCDADVIYENIDYKFTIKKIIINLKNKVILDEDEHIDITSDIKQAVGNLTAVDEEMIEVNEVFRETEKQ